MRRIKIHVSIACALGLILALSLYFAPLRTQRTGAG